MDLFTIKEPKSPVVPIIISVPHSGTKFPKEIKSHYKKRMRKHIDDLEQEVNEILDNVNKAKDEESQLKRQRV